jgi:Lrp/AsnC family transcriptional regulator for asnA, asnC and gidA
VEHTVTDEGPQNAAHLDEIDKAIIRELQLDGRMSYARLGPKVGLSQAAVRQRVQRLTDDHVMQVVAVTDPMRMGFTLQVMGGGQGKWRSQGVGRTTG